jgi:hypothetical protein
MCEILSGVRESRLLLHLLCTEPTPAATKTAPHKREGELWGGRGWRLLLQLEPLLILSTVLHARLEMCKMCVMCLCVLEERDKIRD